MLSIALAMDNEEISQSVLDRFHKELILSRDAYINNCGCPVGFCKHFTKDLSNVIPSLHPAIHTSVVNAGKIIFSNQDEVARIKAFKLLMVKNYISLPDTFAMLRQFSVEDIDLAINLFNANLGRYTRFFDNHYSCVDIAKNHIRGK